MERQEAQRITITPQNTVRGDDKLVITDAQGDEVVILLNKDNEAAVDEFVEATESFHSDPYRYERW